MPRIAFLGWSWKFPKRIKVIENSLSSVRFFFVFPKNGSLSSRVLLHFQRCATITFCRRFWHRHWSKICQLSLCLARVILNWSSSLIQRKVRNRRSTFINIFVQSMSAQMRRASIRNLNKKYASFDVNSIDCFGFCYRLFSVARSLSFFIFFFLHFVPFSSRFTICNEAKISSIAALYSHAFDRVNACVCFYVIFSHKSERNFVCTFCSVEIRFCWSCVKTKRRQKRDIFRNQNRRRFDDDYSFGKHNNDIVCRSGFSFDWLWRNGLKWFRTIFCCFSISLFAFCSRFLSVFKFRNSLEPIFLLHLFGFGINCWNLVVREGKNKVHNIENTKSIAFDEQRVEAKSFFFSHAPNSFFLHWNESNISITFEWHRDKKANNFTVIKLIDS